MLQVDTQPCTIVLATSSNDRLPLETAVVFGDGLVGEVLGGRGPILDQVVDVEDGLVRDKSLRDGMGLGEKEPVVHPLAYR
ncbi:MAG: hypothetical protein ACI9TI_001808 [Natronomonas sp.]